MSSRPFLRSLTQASASAWINFRQWLSRPRVRKGIRLSLLGLGIMLAGGLLLWLALRGSILNAAWDKAAQKLKSKGYSLTCTDKSFTGLFSVGIRNLKLENTNSSLLQAAEIEVTADIWKSIWNGPTIGSLKLDSTSASLINDSNGCNYCGLSSGSRTNEKKSTEPMTQRLFNLLKRGLAKVPGTIMLQEFSISYKDSQNITALHIPALTYSSEDIDGSVRIAENGRQTGFTIKGDLDRSDITGQLQIKPEKGRWSELPLLMRSFGISAGFEAADFRLEELDMQSGVLKMVADGHVSGVTVDDRRLTDTTVIVRQCSGRLVARLGKDFVEIDSATTLSLNKIKTFLYARADLGSKKQYTLKFRADKISANDFFSSLPEGMFRNIQGLQAKGELEYRLYAHLEDDKPYDCVFESELKPYGFGIVKMGATDLRRMNGEFMHTFYERGKPVRSFRVGPSNPSFTPLDAIPETVKKAVMTGEDPAFFNHNGFYAEAIRQSIAQNYVRRKFVRGGSTISMQLVKNVFLSRKKTLARKAEEILIVWLIESQRLTSKARMMEVYLNIIEWGPGVFGIGEASQFYFSRPASELNPLECAFLASVVPMPKSYAYFLDSAGYVSKKNWNFIAIRNNMIKRGDIPETDTASFNVRITGPAARALKKKEPEEEELPADVVPETDILKEEELR